MTDEEQKELNKKMENRDIYIEDDLNPIKDLIDKGADINHQDPYGHTPLLLSIIYCNYNLAKYLIEYGVNLDYQNTRGILSHGTAIHQLIHYRDRSRSRRVHNITGYNVKMMEILKLLLEYGAATDIKNRIGDNVLMFAKKRNQNESIEILEDHIFQKKLLIVHKRLALGKLFYSSLGENMMEEGLYEKISSFV